MVKEKASVNKIIHANSKNLSKHVQPNSVALTITSPPYRNAINYSKHVKNMNKSKKEDFRGNLDQKTSQYLDEMEEIFSEVHKATIDGGFCCIVIGDEIDNGTLIPLPSLLISRLVKENPSDKDWHLRDMIIWNKVTAGRNGAGNRFGIFIQNPLPTYYRSNIMHEYIIILQKGIERRPLDKTITTKLPLNRAMKRQVSLSIWDITPVPPRVVSHPAVFPEQIPWRLIQLYSKKGDIILDPMNGSGQTTKVAKKLGRKYIGVDIRKPYVQLAKKRLKESFQLSNFMTPVYLPIKWVNGKESGKKEDTHLYSLLDISNIPQGYEFVFKTRSSKEVFGIRGTYQYYKNKDRSWICYIITSSAKSTRIKLGSFNDPKSPLQVVLSNIPKKDPFVKATLNEFLPTRLIENRQPIKAIMDVLEWEGFIQKTGAKKGSSEEYQRILSKKYQKIKKKSATVIELAEMKSNKLKQLR